MSLRTISVFKPSQCCRGDIYCFSLNSKETTIIDLKDNFLTATWLPNDQLWATVEGAASLNQCYWLLLQLILPRGHQEPCSPVNIPFTIEFTKVISQLSNSNSNFLLLLFSSMFSSNFFYFLVNFIATF